MTRDHGWRLLTVGRLLERLIGVTARFEAFLEGGALASAAGIDLLLELFDSAITFRARYQRHEDLLALTDLLVLDSSNPRAYAGVLRRLRTELRQAARRRRKRCSRCWRCCRPKAPGCRWRSCAAPTTRPSRRGCWRCRASWRAAAARLADEIGERYFALASDDSAAAV